VKETGRSSQEGGAWKMSKGVSPENISGDRSDMSCQVLEKNASRGQGPKLGHQEEGNVSLGQSSGVGTDIRTGNWIVTHLGVPIGFALGPDARKGLHRPQEM